MAGAETYAPATGTGPFFRSSVGASSGHDVSRRSDQHLDIVRKIPPVRLPSVHRPCARRRRGMGAHPTQGPATAAGVSGLPSNRLAAAVAAVEAWSARGFSAAGTLTGPKSWPGRTGRTGLAGRPHSTRGQRTRRLSGVPSSPHPSPPVADGCPGSCLTPRKAALAGPQAAFACTPIAASAPSTSRASLTLAVTSERSRAMNSRWSERSLASPACFWIQPTRHTGSRNVLPRN